MTAFSSSIANSVSPRAGCNAADTTDENTKHPNTKIASTDATVILDNSVPVVAF